MKGLKSVEETAIRVMRTNSIGFIYNVSSSMQRQLLNLMEKYNPIKIDCSKRKTRAEFYKVLEDELELPHNVRMEEREENIKNELEIRETFLILFNAEGLSDIDYRMMEEFNKGDIAIVFVSAHKRYYKKMLRTKTYTNSTVTELDYSEMS